MQRYCKNLKVPNKLVNIKILRKPRTIFSGKEYGNRLASKIPHSVEECGI
jgi:hypothetical protein